MIGNGIGTGHGFNHKSGCQEGHEGQYDDKDGAVLFGKKYIILAIKNSVKMINCILHIFKNSAISEVSLIVFSKIP